MRYLLDTNMVSDLVRHPRGSVTANIIRVGVANVCTSIIVAAELRFGATKKGSPSLSAQLNAVLAPLEILALEPPVDEAYGHIRADLERRGELIGPNDLMIAAQALALGYTLVTDNESEFRRVAGLVVENWLRPA